MEDMDCQDLVELVTAYLEDDIDPDARVRFETHLGECPGCATYLEQIEQTVHTLGALPRTSSIRRCGTACSPRSASGVDGGKLAAKIIVRRGVTFRALADTVRVAVNVGFAALGQEFRP